MYGLTKCSRIYRLFSEFELLKTAVKVGGKISVQFTVVLKKCCYPSKSLFWRI